MHEEPTPRGGGLAIVVTFFIGLAILSLCAVVSHRTVAAFAVGGLPIAIIGWLDDRKHVSSLIRLAIHLGACGAAVWVYGVEKVCPSSIPPLIGVPIIVVCMAWCVNLYNFMDGLDGFSASEAVFVGVSGALLLGATVAPQIHALGFLAAAACLGFLMWNWPPAKIFMGDSGSGFLGFCFAMFAAVTLKQSGVFVWPILLSVFICDATVTLASRMANGERWSQPHNTHAFQLLAKKSGHAKVTLGLWFVNLLIVLPVAWGAETTLYGPWLCCGLFAVLCCAVLLVRRGKAPQVEQVQN